MNKTFNFYCDESCHLENDKNQYMLISYISVAYNQVAIHHSKIKELQQKHFCFGEIKWSKVSKSQYPFYADLVDYFFATDLQFRAIVVDKSRVNNAIHGQTFDDFYYKMYYQLLYHKINMEYSYNIYLDIKDTLSATKVRRLKDVLKLDYSSIRNVQNIRSHESLLMQVTDLLMGAISYYLRGGGNVIGKNKIIDKIRSHSGLSLDKSTPKWKDKFNLFFIDLK